MLSFIPFLFNFLSFLYSIHSIALLIYLILHHFTSSLSILSFSSFTLFHRSFSSSLLFIYSAIPLIFHPSGGDSDTASKALLGVATNGRKKYFLILVSLTCLAANLRSIEVPPLVPYIQIAKFSLSVNYD